jgi:hypothetical protein
MHGKLTFQRFVLVVAEAKQKGVDEVEPAISKSKAEAALESPFDEMILYPEPVEQAARCCAAIIRERPLPCDNKRVAWNCMLEMLTRYPWAPIDPDRKKISAKLDGLGDGTVEEDEFVRWVRRQVALAEISREGPEEVRA